MEHGIDSIKIEGRMKSELYCATVTKAYAQALRSYQEKNAFSEEVLTYWASELELISHRDYTEASLVTPADETSIYSERNNEEKKADMAALVLSNTESTGLWLDVRRAFYPGDTLEVLTFQGKSVSLPVHEIKSIDDQAVEKTRPSTVVKLPHVPFVEAYNLVRMRCP
jgi:putative protease